MSLIVSVFPKVLTPKEVVTWTSKTPCFRTPFGNQRVHEFQTLSKSAQHHYYLIVPWIWDKLSWKKCRLVRFEILELFVNTLTTDDKYSSRNIQNLTQQLQTTMSQKQKTFYRILLHMSNLEQVQIFFDKLVWTCSRFDICNKNSIESLLFLRHSRLKLLGQILDIATGILVIGSQCVNKQF